MLSALSFSDLPILQDFAVRDYEKTQSRARTPSVVKQFGANLASLMRKIDSTMVSYVRCLAPNRQRAASLVEEDALMDQLHTAGILETVKIRKAGYMHRISYNDFATRYYCS